MDSESITQSPTLEKNTSKVLVVGDMHGNLFSWGRTVVPAIRRHHPDVILQVGDFGFGWDAYYLEALDAILDDTRAPDVIWLCGNHENFDLLEEVGAFDAAEPTKTSERTWYLPRGYAWEWQGRHCMALGGAYSVDKPYRKAHVSWWPQETITEKQVQRAMDTDFMDVVFAHDAFAGFRVPGPHAKWKQAGEFDRLSMPNRLCLLDVVALVKPSLYVHGHYHYGYEMDTRAKGHDVHVVGLSNEDEIGSMMLLDFPSLNVTVL